MFLRFLVIIVRFVLAFLRKFRLGNVKKENKLLNSSIAGFFLFEWVQYYVEGFGLFFSCKESVLEIKFGVLGRSEVCTFSLLFTCVSSSFFVDTGVGSGVIYCICFVVYRGVFCFGFLNSREKIFFIFRFVVVFVYSFFFRVYIRECAYVYKDEVYIYIYIQVKFIYIYR